jgi:hypothetical protein
MLVSEWQSGQIICLRLSSRRAWMLWCLFLLINELAEGWLINGPPRSDEKEGILAHAVTVPNNYVRGE